MTLRSAQHFDSQSPRLAQLFRLGLLLATLCGGVEFAQAASAPAYVDEMGGERSILRFQGTQDFRLLGQQGEEFDPLLESTAEVITLRGPSGETAQIRYPLPSSPVIAELSIRSRILSNRRGVQIAALVTLPRSVDPQTQTARKLVVRGSNLSVPNTPTLLTLEKLPTLLKRQARVEQLKTKVSLDTREAYVSQLAFLVPGGTGATRIAVDWVELHGILQDQKVDAMVAKTAFETPVNSPDERSVFAQPPVPQSPLTTHASQRIIQWQGEPFDFLAELGFTCVWMPVTPDEMELAEARRLSLSVVCPPPTLANSAPAPLGPEWDPVISWNLGPLTNSQSLNQKLQLRQQIRRIDTRAERMVLFECQNVGPQPYRAVDQLLLRHPLLGSTTSIREYAIWLDQHIRLSRPGTPVWVGLETHLPTPAASQISLLTGSQEPALYAASYGHLCTAITSAVSVRCRDFFFESQAPLTKTDHETKKRCLALGLLNLRLKLLNSWISSESKIKVARSNQPGVSALLLKSERSNLLLPVEWSRDCRTQSNLQAGGPIKFVVPGISESADAYLLSLTGAERITHERTAGGILLSLPSLPVDGLILLTNDPHTFSHVSQYLRSIARRAAAKRRDLLSLRLQELDDELAEGGLRSSDLPGQLLQQAQLQLTRCDQAASRGQLEYAYRQLEEGEALASKAEYHLRMHLGDLANSELAPLEFSVRTAQEAAGLGKVLGSFARGEELLPGGELEDLAALLQAGWLQQQTPQPGIASDVRLSSESPAGGSDCLELESRAMGSDTPIAVVPTPPVWIETPAVRLEQGDLVEISGRVRVPEPLIGSVDGLKIVDSLGQDALAIRVSHAPSWTSFHYYRRAASATELSLKLQLTGLGRAQVDSLSIRKVLPPAAAFARQRQIVSPR